MSLDYLSHFGLSAPPFCKDIGDAELWMPPSKQSLVEDLTDAMHARASALLTGEPGVGKTCVLRALRHALMPANFRLVYCQNTTVGRRDFYRHLCLALGLAKVNTAGDLFLAVSTHVEDLAKERVCPVFLVDEAHLLHQDTLDHLHILLNYQWDAKPLLSLLLIGLPELDDRLRLRRNRSLYSRLHHRFTIGSLVPDDTNDYIRSRLARVGATKDIFSADALAILHEAAGSSLRDTDRMATAALRSAARRKKKLVERDLLTRILQSESEDRA
jgi:type II secretory pathway predicted ATPase ExeA